MAAKLRTLVLVSGVLLAAATVVVADESAPAGKAETTSLQDSQAGPPIGDVFEKEKQQTEELLKRLSSYEDELLKQQDRGVSQENRSRKNGTGNKAQPKTESDLRDKLDQAAELNRRLQEQLEQSQRELLLLRQRTSVLEREVEQARNARNEDAETSRKEAETENQALKSELARMKVSCEEARGPQERSDNTQGELEAAKNQLSTKDEEITSLKRQLSKSFEELRACGDKSTNFEKRNVLQLENEQLRQQLLLKEKEASACRTSSGSLSEMEAKLQELEKEVVAARNELLMKDSELDLLKQSNSSVRRTGSGTVRPVVQTSGRSGSRRLPTGTLNTPLQQRAPLNVREQPQPAGSDVMLIEVKSPKVNLRSGPGNEHSPIMQVDRGTRLTVETREGDWFRVITPTGSRAYIRKDVISIVEGGKPQPVERNAMTPELTPPKAANGAEETDPSAMVSFGEVKIGGRSPDAKQDIEAAAFEKLKSKLGGTNKNEGSLEKPE